MGDQSCLVVGCGAVGILYTYILSHHLKQSNIYAVCRSNHAAASENGFRIDSEAWGQGLTCKPVVVGSVGEAAEKHGRAFDYILVCTKSSADPSQMAAMLAPAVAMGSTRIALFQNGIAVEDCYARAYPTNPIISVVVYVKATEVAKAVVEHNNVEQLHLGSYPSSAPSTPARELGDALASGGASVTVHDDVQTERWSKALINSVWNPLSALTRLGDGAFLMSDDGAEEAARVMMRETAAIARACGVAGIDDELVERQLARNVARKPVGQKMSMYFDAVAGRPMEVDAIIGNVVQLGEQHKVPTPSLKLLYLLVKALNNSFAVS
ncbi:unnamed protein product [Clonostachys byssicola]|uniref:2-dehydropantoate 2-reductase n=1 Tax=Clonostachys byssicola TaxID=160290 RepID=A0A9N9XXA1_9HYPO|nr:unnamed protein product [Clonostachys byssicola]